MGVWMFYVSKVIVVTRTHGCCSNVLVGNYGDVESCNHHGNAKAIGFRGWGRARVQEQNKVPGATTGAWLLDIKRTKHCHRHDP